MNKKTLILVMAMALSMTAIGCSVEKNGMAQESSGKTVVASKDQAESSASESSQSESVDESTSESSSEELSGFSGTESSVESSATISRSEKLKSDFAALLAKKKELQEGILFAKQKVSQNENAVTVNYTLPYYYCDAVIKDINHDGEYEMIVKYIMTMTGGVYFDSFTSENTSTIKSHYSVVYDLYTVHDGKAVSCDYLDIQKSTAFVSQW